MSNAETTEDIERRLLEDQTPALAALGLPEPFVLPDYERSIANLPPTLAEALGAEMPGALPALPSAWWQDMTVGVRRVVYIIMDAVGWFRFRGLLEADGSLLYSRLARSGRLYPITSIFPSTTTSALTTIWTGYAAAQHGLVGHNLYFPALGAVVDLLGFCPAGEPRDECLVERGLVAEELVPVPALAQVLGKQGVTTRVLIRRSFADSALSRLHFRGVEEVVGFVTSADLCTILADQLAHYRHERLLLAAYWSHIDTVGHLRGPDSRSWRAELQNLAYSLEEAFLKPLSPADRAGTLLVMTADHGQMAAGRTSAVHLGDHPDLQTLLWMPPTGGPRAAYLTALPGELESLKEYLGMHLRHNFAWLDAQAALDAGLLGPGAPTRSARHRLGDVILLGHRDHTLEQRQRDQPLRGIHGGLSSCEMLVPFLVVRLD